MHNAFFDVDQEFSCSIRYHPEEFSSSDAVVTNRHATVVDADDDHDVSDVHLLQHSQQFVACTIFSVVIEALCEDFFLLDGVHLTHSVRKNSVFGSCKL